METFNTSIAIWLNSFAGQSVFFDFVIIFLAKYLAYLLIIVFIASVLIQNKSVVEKSRIFLATVISGVIGRGFIVEGIRYFYHHDRPFVSISTIHQLVAETGYSLPSGHATFFFGLSAIIYSYNKKLGTVFFTLSAIMGLARIISGVHYPLDILVGAILGTIVGFVSYTLQNKILSKYQNA